MQYTGGGRSKGTKRRPAECKIKQGKRDMIYLINQQIRNIFMVWERCDIFLIIPYALKQMKGEARVSTRFTVGEGTL